MASYNYSISQFILDIFYKFFFNGFRIFCLYFCSGGGQIHCFTLIMGTDPALGAPIADSGEQAGYISSYWLYRDLALVILKWIF